MEVMGAVDLAVHKELNAESAWCESFMHDAAELIWNTYGITPAIGRSIEKMALRHMSGVRLRIDDDAYDDGYKREQFKVERPKGQSNRFTFERQTRSRKSTGGLPHKMSMELHQQVGDGLKRVDRFLQRLTTMFRGRRACKSLKHGSLGVVRLRSQMAARLRAEHPDALLSIYLNEGEPEPIDPMADRLVATFPPTPATPEEARTALQKVMDAEPLLNANGIGYYQSYCGKTLDDRKAWHERLRARLLDEYVDAFLRCCRWLDTAVRTKNPSRSGGSYYVKHVVERVTDGYVPNGAFIAAAFYKRIPFVHDGGGSPNVTFALSQKWLREQDHLTVARDDQRDAEV